MTKTELEKQIKELENKQAELQKQINGLKQIKIEEPKKRWKPEYDEKYYYIIDGGFVCWDYWGDTTTDNWRYLTNNVFKTQEETEECKKKLDIQSRFKNFVEERSEELDWNDTKKEKWFIYYSFCRGKIDFDEHYSSKCQGVIYASSEQILRDAIAEIGEDNIKKYVLEVEE